MKAMEGCVENIPAHVNAECRKNSSIASTIPAQCRKNSSIASNIPGKMFNFFLHIHVYTYVTRKKNLFKTEHILYSVRQLMSLCVCVCVCVHFSVKISSKE